MIIPNSLSEAQNELVNLLNRKDEILNQYSMKFKSLFSQFQWKFDCVDDKKLTLVNDSISDSSLNKISIKYVKNDESFDESFCFILETNFLSNFDMTDEFSNTKKYINFIGFLCAKKNINITNNIKNTLNELYNELYSFSEDIKNIRVYVNIFRLEETKRQREIEYNKRISAVKTQIENGNSNLYIISDNTLTDNKFVYRKKQIFISSLPLSYENAVEQVKKSYNKMNLKIIPINKIKIMN